MNKNKIIRRRLFNICILLISFLTISLFSSENGSASNNTSEIVVEKIVEIVIHNDEKKNEIVANIMDNYLFVVRKCAHFIEFVLLGFFMINFIHDYKKITPTIIVYAIIASCLLACLDEFHQLFSYGRTARVFDVLVDTSGASFGTFIYYKLYQKYNNNKKITSNQ